MEIFYGGISTNRNLILHVSGHKTLAYVNKRTHQPLYHPGIFGIDRIRAGLPIYVKSFVGMVLALLSLGSTVYFLYLLSKAQQAAEKENE